MIQTTTIEGLEKVDVDFNDERLSLAVRKLQPVVFNGRSGFCCVLGPNPQTGVFGYGATIVDALQNFDEHLSQTEGLDPDVVRFIAIKLGNEE